MWSGDKWHHHQCSLLLSVLSSGQVLSDMVVLPPEKHQRAMDCLWQTSISHLKEEQWLSYSLNERHLFWGHEMPLVLKAPCWGLTLTKWFLQRQYISFTSWIFDDVHHFNIFLRSCNKNNFCTYNSFLQTRVTQAVFPVSLCPCSLISLYLSTSWDLPSSVAGQGMTGFSSSSQSHICSPASACLLPQQLADISWNGLC